ncbi:hypothetical protein B0T26DRAFT_716196 [Lasiosphaeria miniovina]|uniref:Uncharacterized protein n=1 Tax=Lasiosphaeria miniovina TaxID=1954250 RepID=A0AA40AC97_9PEZI|nr:uncharacterized protein B0T26DRAFT_716196 [Lasiosphaeria miniovina]KAK0713053.1 hypothetical protein B0T26DRAFT_716196 [Lasiosphaeria miniovina]
MPNNHTDFQADLQECWDRTANIIDECVETQAKVGWWNGLPWWNGDHVFQYYGAGLRPLNDPTSYYGQKGKFITNYLMPVANGKTCYNKCCVVNIRVGSSDWCKQNCGVPFCGRPTKARPVPAISARRTEKVAGVGGCDLPYILPDCPSSGDAEKIGAVQKFYDRDDTPVGNNNCNNPRLAGPAAKKAGSVYDSESRPSSSSTQSTTSWLAAALTASPPPRCSR